jgi:small subunit ribosomal protein S16
MLVIRLARVGRKKYPTYRVVAAEKSNAATGKFIEILGRYNPHTKDLALDKEGIAKRVSQGAQPSNTVLKLMVREGMELPKWAKIAQKTSPSKNPVEETPEEAAAEAEAEIAADEAAAPEAPTEDAAPVQEEAPVEAATDPDVKAEASNDAQEAAADGAEAVTLEKAKGEPKA